MDIFSLLSLIGGLSLFLYGMTIMGDGLVQLSGGSLKRILGRMTGNRLTALLLGTLVTAVIQSSSATTVMVVGCVNSGIMTLSQAVGVIMGANIGTTVTSWILSLTGITGSSVFIRLLKPSSFTPVLALIGIISLMTSKEGSRKKDIGTVLLGFAVLMTGMETMSSSVSPLSKDPGFTSLLTAFSHPILGLMAGAILTAIIQSSSASVGILQALCITGAVTYGTAIPIIMGQNIGTCITAILSSIGANRSAKRASLIHLYFNLIGTLLFMIVFYSLNSFLHFGFLANSANAAGIAVIHSCFNIGSAAVLFPFANQLVRLATLTIPEKAEKTEPEPERPASLAALDERFLETPALAMQLCKSAVDDMANLSRKAFQTGMDVLAGYDESRANNVIAMEQEADQFEDILGTYLVKLSRKDLTQEDSRLLSLMLHCISDFERISDHAINIVESAQELHRKGLSFTDTSRAELAVFSRTLSDILDLTSTTFVTLDLNLARGVEPLEEVVDSLRSEIKQRHIERLRGGNCSMEAGLILEDILTNYERVSDHCSNVAVALIELRRDEFDTHEYLDITVKGNDPWFQKEYARLRQLYALPA